MSVTTTSNVSELIVQQISGKSFSNFEQKRKEALKSLAALGLPAAKNEEYKFTPITRILEKNFSFTSAKPAGIVDENVLLKGDFRRLVFVNGVLSEKLSDLTPANGLTIAPLAAANDKVGKKFGSLLNHEVNAFAAWNTAAWEAGVYIAVEAGKVIEQPIVIQHVIDSSAGEVVSVVRNLIHVAKSAEVTIIETFHSTGSNPDFLNLATETFVEENAGLNYYSLQNNKGNHYLHNQHEIHQEKSSRVSSYTFSLDGKLIRNNLHLALDGENIESHMYGLYLIAGETLADNHTVADHRKAHSFSNELYKGIVDGNAKGVFNGKIYVRPNAQKTNAFQANRNILLSDRATVNTKPQLEIWADDVKCSHGCTSGQLDEEALFYLQARGISKDKAKAMMLYAFAGEVLDNIRNDYMKTLVEEMVAKRLNQD